MSKIIAVNAGSSSLKFQLFNMPSEEVITSGLIERIGLDTGIFSITVNGEKVKKELVISDHTVAVNLVLEALIEHKILADLSEIEGVGHRVVHGGEYFPTSVVVDSEVINKVEELSELAPLHNPANLIGYRAFKAALNDVEHVFVFDTAFHQTMKPEVYLYPLPYEYYTDYKIRRYGFHGTSHFYVSKRVSELMNKEYSEVNTIVCHLGNGASLSAVQGGKVINTSMGFTPLSGIMMGTRTGDVDPAIMPFIMEKTGLSAQQVLDIYNKKSGMLGVSGISSDARDVENAANNGDERAIITRELYANRIAQIIGSYFVQLGHVDAIVFTAGLGENDHMIRKACIDLVSEALKTKIDEQLNNVRSKEVRISTPDSEVEVWIVPTNEEVIIARDTQELLKK